MMKRFVAAVRYQLKNSTCYVYSDNVQYRFKDADGNNKIVIPDASINCRTKSRRGNTFTDDPRFVMEVLSPSTEKYDRTEKMELYAHSCAFQAGHKKNLVRSFTW